jgi:hypothetical protein
MIVAILIILLFVVIIFYATSTTEHLFHSVRMAGRMSLVIAFVLLVLGLIIYSYFMY